MTLDLTPDELRLAIEAIARLPVALADPRHRHLVSLFRKLQEQAQKKPDAIDPKPMSSGS
jgi:hypothetical protein